MFFFFRLVLHSAYFSRKLFQDSASRSPAANLERNKIWRQITEEINKKYSHLNTLTYEQCKKLCKYYKRKDPTNYGIAFHSMHGDLIPSAYKEQQQQAAAAAAAVANYVPPNVQMDEPVDVDELLEANDVVDGICCDSGNVSDNLPHSAASSSSSTDGLVITGQHATATAMAAAAAITNQQKKERGQFVCKLAENFNGVFDSHSRLYHINAERNQVWKQITDTANEKFGAELGDLTIEQTKKLYANYRRKSQAPSFGSATSTGEMLRSETNSINGSAALVLDAASTSPDLLNRLVAQANGGNGSSSVGHTRTVSPHLPRLTSRDRKTHGETTKNGFANHVVTGQRLPANPSLSTVELLAIIADRDAEIKQLKNIVLQKSVEHQLQISRILEKVAELVKTAVNANVQREIMSAMTGMGVFGYNNNNGYCNRDYENDGNVQ
ncbi:unnamed protein product [Gongylonema pulchrum]|uniref:Regulatory protein zeste n=1 Tax=Gongylonema pulchrum TaxID=637853 RepID=A0A183E5J7_9BILA|nr:unnamed protein product [Gongylonema pulchrum]